MITRRYIDAETGFVYLRARYHDPAKGQFISRDPLAALTGSPYGYAGENPLNARDPLGLARQPRVPPTPTSSIGALSRQNAGCTADPAYPTRGVTGSGVVALVGAGAAVALLIALPEVLPVIGAAETRAVLADWAESSGILRDASVGKGNFGLGQATEEVANRTGQAWVGDKATLASDGKTLASADGLRQYRLPTFKPNLGVTQANFESRWVPRGKWQTTLS